MSSLRIVLFASVALTLAACDRYLEERYLVRRDATTSSAGDAVASNSAVQIPTPWPRNSHNTNIAFDGAKIAGAVKAYREDKEFLRNQPIQLTDTPNIGRAPATGAGEEPGAGPATGAGPGAGPAAGPGAGPPPGQGYGTGAAPVP